MRSDKCKDQRMVTSYFRRSVGSKKSKERRRDGKGVRRDGRGGGRQRRRKELRETTKK